MWLILFTGIEGTASLSAVLHGSSESGYVMNVPLPMIDGFGRSSPTYFNTARC
jgi:hypothetical protein